jgi:tetratricopeptide (TPR) repeat protein
MAAALVLCCLPTWTGCRRRAPAPAPPSRRVLLVGVDGADWSAIDPLVAAGRLPAFARLRAAGRTATLVATPPLVSPILWTTIATGRHPDDHGVLDFMVDLPSGGQGPVGSMQRRTPALWSLFSAHGRRVAVVGWWATWPAEDVRGTIVSDQLAPQLTRPDPALSADVIAPAATAPVLLPLLVRPEAVSLEDLQRYVSLSDAGRREALEAAGQAPSRFYANRVAHLAAVVAGTRTYVAMAEKLLRDEKPDLAAVYLEPVDTLSHLFVRQPQGARAIEQAYADVDGALLRLAAAVPPDTWVIVCSDHGFHGPSAGIAEDPADLAGPATAWHRPYGIAAAAEARELLQAGGPAAPPSTAPATLVTPLDLAPTVLHAAGLPVEAAMAGAPARLLLPLDRAALTPARSAQTAVAAPRARAAPAAAIDESALARLQALGYVGSRPSSLARQNLGESLFRRGAFDAAARAFRSATEAQPGSLGAWLWLARAEHAQGRTHEALQAWSAALRLPGGPEAALVPAVDAAVAAGRAADAERMIAASGAAPAAPRQTARAIVASARGQARAALDALRGALRADPLSFDAAFRLFELLHRAGRAREALPPLERAAAAAPGSARHAALLGEALLAAGEAATAERHLRHALDLAPDGVAVRLDLARAQLAQRRAADALATAQPAPPSAQRSILLGAAYAGQSRWSDAAGEYLQALASGPPTPEVLNGLGWALHKQGRQREAADALRRSLALRADQPHIRQLLGTLGS